MSRRRWIADQVSGNRAVLAGDQAVHLVKVLRGRVGQEFEIAADGRLRRGRIAAIHPDKVEFELGTEIPASALPDVTLVLAVFKFDRMEWAIEKATELGVSRIVPLIAKRTESHLASAAQKRVERWRRLAREAAQQSRRIAPPEIAVPIRIAEACTLSADRRIVLSEAEDQVSLKQALAGANNNLALAIGPEGGWGAEEEQGFRQHGWIAASLGPTILRVETAAIAAISIVMSEVM